MSRLALLVCTLAALALAGCVSLFPRSYDAAVDATVPGLVYGDAPPTPGVSTCPRLKHEREYFQLCWHQ